jgi:dienelactone hydrolase
VLVTQHARTLLGTLAALSCLAGAGCGDSTTATTATTSATTTTATETRAAARGADRYWIFGAKNREPRAFVVFLHGHGDPVEMTPANHRPWLRHLADRGDVVVYPQYEDYPGQTGAVPHIVRAAQRAWRNIGAQRCLPVVVIGYSRGGGLAVKYAASASRAEPIPDAVVSVFPGSSEEAPVDLRRLPVGIQIRVMIGDRDQVVGNQGAIALLNGLRRAGFNPDNVEVVVVRSRGGFVATHGSVFDTSPQAKREFWRRTDRLIERLRLRC